MGGWLRRLGRFVWRNIDAIFVIVVAFGVAVLQVLGKAGEDLVAAAILGLLGVTAIVLLRDREAREDLSDLRQLAGDAISDRPYEVIWQVHEWSLESRARSVVKVIEQLRFTRNEVSTLVDWSSGSGRVESYQAKWRRSKSDQWIKAKMIHKFPIRSGEKVIHSLDEEHSRGDQLDWCVERIAADRFPEDHESVSVEARTKSDHPRVLRIIWSPDVEPTHVELRLSGLPARTLAPKRKNGRLTIEEKVANLPVGSRVEIAWAW